MLGRPTLYSQELADLICNRLIAGESLRGICRDDAMPGTTAVMKWLGIYPDFAEQYARARELQADALADEIVLLSDESRIGRKVTEKADGTVETVTADMVERTRLQIDARKWFASKLAPKKYGDRQHVDVDAKVRTTTQLSDEQALEEIAALSAQLGGKVRLVVVDEEDDE